MLTCFNVQKHIIFQLLTVHYCSSSMPRLSQTCHFLQSPSFWQAQSALIGQLSQCIVIGRTPQACVGNATPLAIIVSFCFQSKYKDSYYVLRFTISSSPRGEHSHMTDTMMMLVYICSTQATVKTAGSTVMCPALSLSLSHTHTHTHTTRYSTLCKTPHLNSQ